MTKSGTAGACDNRPRRATPTTYQHRHRSGKHRGAI